MHHNEVLWGGLKYFFAGWKWQQSFIEHYEACSVVGWCNKPEGQFPMRSLNFSMYLIFPVALWSRGWLSFQKKWAPGIILRAGEKRGRRVKTITSPPFASPLSRKCWIFGVSHPYKSPRPVRGIAFMSAICWTPSCFRMNHDTRNIICGFGDIGYTHLRKTTTRPMAQA
jgi:hypothetical protein